MFVEIVLEPVSKLLRLVIRRSPLKGVPRKNELKMLIYYV
jgi:hypothetical protein